MPFYDLIIKMYIKQKLGKCSMITHYCFSGFLGIVLTCSLCFADDYVQSAKLVVVQAGFTADALAASDLPASSFATLTQTFAQDTALAGTWATRSAAVDEAQRSLDEANLQLRQSGSSPDLVTAQSAAASSLDSAKTLLAQTRSQVQAELCAAVATSLSEHDNAILAHMIANSGKTVPPEYRVLDLTAKQWRLLQSALNHTAAAAANGEAPSLTEAESSVLSSANSNSDVVLARSRIAEGRAAIEQAIAAASSSN